MLRFTKVFVAILLMVCVAACSGGDNAGKEASGSSPKSATKAAPTTSEAANFSGKKFTDSAEGFSIEFPADWETRPKYSGTVVISLSPVSGPSDRFRENVNVVTEPLPTPMDIETYYQANLKGMEGALKNFKILGKKTVSISGKPAIQVVTTHEMGQITAKALAYFMTHNNKGYVITCTATPDSFDATKSQFEQISNTFTFQ